MLQAKNIKSDVFSHGFFTREGGVSKDIYASLNCGYGSGDCMEKVRENRAMASKKLGSKNEIFTCYQIHSNIAHSIDKIPEKPLEGDAIVTNVPGLAIGVLTADCVPIFLADDKQKIVAAVHAGWKGAVSGVINSAIGKMEALGASRQNISAAIGPSISSKSYEVGEEIREVFTQENSGNSEFFTSAKRAQHYMFDLKAYVAKTIFSSAIANLELLDYDTYVEETHFFSFRRATHRLEKAYGRQISAIMIKEI